MRVSIPTTGLILIVTGILVFQIGLMQVTKSVSRWHLIGVRRGVDSFSGNFLIGSYKITVNEVDDGFIELFDTPRNLVKRFDFNKTFEEGFLITKDDEYHFYCHNYDLVSNLVVKLYMESIEDHTIRPFGGWERVGRLAFLTGVSVYCYGTSGLRTVKGRISSSQKQQEGRSGLSQ